MLFVGFAQWGSSAKQIYTLSPIKGDLTPLRSLVSCLICTHNPRTSNRITNKTIQLYKFMYENTKLQLDNKYFVGDKDNTEFSINQKMSTTQFNGEAAWGV